LCHRSRHAVAPRRRSRAWWGTRPSSSRSQTFKSRVIHSIWGQTIQFSSV
jgi:hypothetical protein